MEVSSQFVVLSPMWIIHSIMLQKEQYSITKRVKFLVSRFFKSCGTYRFSFLFSPTYFLLTLSECSWLFTAKEQLSKFSGFQEKDFWNLALFQAKIQMFKLKGVNEYSLCSRVSCIWNWLCSIENKRLDHF